MEMCRVSLYLAYAMAIYCLASAYYIVRTRSIGTPFNDSLTSKQIAIKDKSAALRRNIFMQGVGGGLLLMMVMRPFANCT
jgi:hypothetical protein